MNDASFDISFLPLPVRVSTPVPMTDDELLRFSSDNSALRIEQEPNGDLTIMTPGGGNTGKMNLQISRLLGNWAETDGRGYGFDSSTGFRLPDGSVRSPDASWVAKERWDALSEMEQTKYSPLCPEFVIELTSPTDRPKDVRRKMLEDWMPNGVRVGWVIDPKAKTVTIYRAGEDPETLVDPSSVQGTGPMRGFELVMSRVWG